MKVLIMSLMTLLSDVLPIDIGFNLDVSLATASAVSFPHDTHYLVSTRMSLGSSDSTNSFLF